MEAIKSIKYDPEIVLERVLLTAYVHTNYE